MKRHVCGRGHGRSLSCRLEETLSFPGQEGSRELPAPCAPAPLPWGLLWSPLPERRLCGGLVWSGAKCAIGPLSQDLLGGVGGRVGPTRVITTIPASALGFTRSLYAVY